MGDRVNLVSQERLDNPDARALQELGYEYAARAFGGLLGAGGGCVAPFVVTEHGTDGAGAYWAVLSAFAFYHPAGGHLRPSVGAEPDVYATHEGQITTVNPDAQSTQVPYTLARNAAAAWRLANPATATVPEDTANALPWLWARTIQVEEDEDARRAWSTDLRVEGPITINTRLRERAEFVFADTRPDADGGTVWVRVGKLTGWGFSGSNPTTPTIRALSMWDSPDLSTWTKESTSLRSETTSQASLLPMLTTGASADYDLDPIPDDARDLGLVRLLWLIRNRLRRHLAGGSGDPSGTPGRSWLHVPKYSLRGLQKLHDETVIPEIDALKARKLAWKGFVSVGVVRESVEIVDPDWESALSSVAWSGEGVESVSMKRATGDGSNTEGFFTVVFREELFTGTGNLTTAQWHISVTATPDTSVDAEDTYIATVRVMGARTIRVNTMRVVTASAGHSNPPEWWHFWCSFRLMLHGPVGTPGDLGGELYP